MRVAIVGSGISGLAAAYHMRQEHDVHVFEAAARPGGHASTATVLEGDRDVRIDTGFIVYNHQTYPGFTSMLEELGVQGIETDMSFAVSCAIHGNEYSSRGYLSGALRQAARLRLDRIRTAWEIRRFYQRAVEVAAAVAGPSDTLGDFLDEEGFSEEFRRHFIIPLVSAIWSTPAGKADQYPVRSLLGFFKNHGLLNAWGRLRWRTVQGGSATYVDALVERLPNPVRTSTSVVGIDRDESGVTLHLGGGFAERFDHVVIATHSDQALRMLVNPTAAERGALGAIAYEPNRVVLHRDARVMPKQRREWSSWNYVTNLCAEAPGPVSLTYHMNRLQRLDAEHDYFVTVNPQVELDSDLVIEEFEYAHPQFTTATLAAQHVLKSINGQNHTHFAGAYLGHGFHEDGFRTGARAARDLAGRSAPDVLVKAAA